MGIDSEVFGESVVKDRKARTTPATSPTPRLPSTPTDLLNISNKLTMLQTVGHAINRAKLPGVRCTRATIVHDGHQVPALIMDGCKWDAKGQLVLADEK